MVLPPGWDAAVGTVLPEPDVVPSAVLPGCVAELVGVVLLLPGWDAAVVGVVLLPGWLAELLSVLLPGCAADDDSEDVPGRSVTLVSAIPDSLAEVSLFLWFPLLSVSFVSPFASVSAADAALWLLEMVSSFTRNPSASVSCAMISFRRSSFTFINSFLLMPFACQDG